MVSTTTKQVPEPPLLSWEEVVYKNQLAQTAEQGSIVTIPVRRIRPFTQQPRTYFNQERLEALGNSMRNHGQMQPIAVKWLPEDRRYYCELIDGERRWWAAQIAQLPTLQAFVVNVANKGEQYVRAVISNFGREGHTPLETAQAIDTFLKSGWTVEQIATGFTKSRQWVYLYHKLMRLAPEVQKLLNPALPEKERLKPAVASILASLPSDLQIRLAKEVLEQRLTAVAALQYIRVHARQEGAKAGDPERPPREDYRNFKRFLRVLQDRIDVHLTTPAHVRAAMFEYRDPADYEEALEELNQLCVKLQQLRDAFARIKNNVPTS